MVTVDETGAEVPSGARLVPEEELDVLQLPRDLKSVGGAEEGKRLPVMGLRRCLGNGREVRTASGLQGSDLRGA